MESGRHARILIGMGIAATVLICKLFYIQIVDDKFKKDALNNSVLHETVYPPRGIIYDRNGNVLVGNRICYDVVVTPREVTTLDTLALAEALGIDTLFIRERMQFYRKWRSRIGFKSQIFLKQVPAERYLPFAEQIYRFPGFSGQVRSIREYPFNAGGNLLGYVSEVSPEYIRDHPEYKAGDLIGKTGIEGAREKDLRGEKGDRIFLRDSRNRILTRYNNGEDDIMAIPGKDIVTTIDAHLQQYGQELMQGKVGSLVAIEPSTGEILAMVSSPGIDVDFLSEFNLRYPEVAGDPYKPLFNRTTQASYPPGSVFKLVNGLIGLEEGVLKPSYKYPCDHGFYYTSSKKLGCHEHKSPIGLDEAIRMSCNSYFCFVFRNILDNPKYGSTGDAFNAWRDYVTSFGFGSPLGSDFPAELGGSIPTAEYYDRIYGKDRWRFPSIVSLSIGQGEIGVTPLQIANLSATVANRGYYYIPHIVKSSDNLDIDPKFSERHYTKVDTINFSKVIDGMWQAVNSPYGDGGTATVAAVPGLDICGKTGTAQNPHGEDNSVFICFAPRDNPRIAVAAYIENAGFGATWACPIASLLVEQYLNGDVSRQRQWLEDRVKGTVLIH